MEDKEDTPEEISCLSVKVHPLIHAYKSYPGYRKSRTWLGLSLELIQKSFTPLRPWLS